MERKEVVVLICAGLMILGAFGPWAKVYGFHVNGMSQGGILVLICAIASALGIYQHFNQPSSTGALWAPVSGFGIATVLSFYKINQIQTAAKATSFNLKDLGAGSGTISFVGTEWGLQLVLLSAIVGAILAVIMLIRAYNDA